MFKFEVVNVGRRPVYFAGLVIRDDIGRVIDEPLGPLEDEYINLQPGEVLETPMSEPYVNHDIVLRASKIVAYDGLGRRTRLSRWSLWRLHRQTRKTLAEDRALQRRP